MSYIETKVKAIMMDKLGVEEHALDRKASFRNDLGVDSLDMIETIMELEKEFSITIPDEAAEKLTTVGSVIDYIVAQKN
ncbi:MAG: acyl carrier protein [Sphingobacteriales bacterium 50-39]|nr:acyl carrier protein [Sphingobacteriales bacterium]OJW56193.1 MAG: acyl carrier protein [Sphingobacteriales bacterium 50-39]